MDLALDSDHDIYLTDGGDLAVVEDDLEGYLQRASIALRTALGEYHWDTSAGVAYLRIRGARGDEGRRLAAADVRRVLLSLEGTDAVDDIVVDIDPETRHLTVRASVRTLYGRAEVYA